MCEHYATSTRATDLAHAREILCGRYARVASTVKRDMRRWTQADQDRARAARCAIATLATDRAALAYVGR